jgi:hypothetical protein
MVCGAFEFCGIFFFEDFAVFRYKFKVCGKFAVFPFRKVNCRTFERFNIERYASESAVYDFYLAVFRDVYTVSGRKSERDNACNGNNRASDLYDYRVNRKLIRN